MLDWLVLIVSGIFIGIIVAAPVGPVNLICIRRTLAFGKLNGFLSGTGAALGDGVFAVIVAFGLTAVSSFIEGHAGWFETAGGLVLIGMGVHTFYSNPRPYMNPADVSLPVNGGSADLATAVASTFFLTISNPATMLGFVAIFSGMGASLTANASYGSATVLVGSVVLGSTLWWAMLTGVMGLFKGKMNFKRLRLINQGSGVLVTVFGVVVLARVAWNAFT